MRSLWSSERLVHALTGSVRVKSCPDGSKIGPPLIPRNLTSLARCVCFVFTLRSRESREYQDFPFLAFTHIGCGPTPETLNWNSVLVFPCHAVFADRSSHTRA